RIIASCNGLVIVPRGGFSTIRDAVRYGLDIFADPFEDSPNKIMMTEAIGLNLEDFFQPQARTINDGYVTSPENKQNNKIKLGAFENKCIQWFRTEFGVCG